MDIALTDEIPPEKPDIRSHIVYRCCPEAHQWASRLADHLSLNLTNLHWQALIRMAEISGFHEKVPHRYRRPLPPRPRRPNVI